MIPPVGAKLKFAPSRANLSIIRPCVQLHMPHFPVACTVANRNHSLLLLLVVLYLLRLRTRESNADICYTQLIVYLCGSQFHAACYANILPPHHIDIFFFCLNEAIALAAQLFIRCMLCVVRPNDFVVQILKQNGCLKIRHICEN